MKTRIGTATPFLALLVLGGLFGHSRTAAQAPPENSWTQAPLEGWEPILERFAARLAAEVASDEVGGITAAVTRNGEVLWASGFGWADRDARIPAGPRTIYRVGSITKSLTAVAMMQLVETGVLGLDDPITEHLREASGFVDESGGDVPPVITLRQLASHTAGLIREPRLQGAASGPIEGWEDKVLASIAETAVFREPGTGYQYSNIGFGTLGLAISRAADTPFRELMRARIFEPMEMSSSTFVIGVGLRERLAVGYANGRDGQIDADAPARQHAGRGYKVPNGGWYADVADLARFMALALGQYPEALGAEAARTLRTIQTPEDPERGYGLGFSLRPASDGTLVMGHGGSVAGYTAQIWSHVPSGLGVVLLRNYNRGATNLSQSSFALLEELVLRETGDRPAEHFDVVLRGGRVLDGTGSPDLRADVGIRGDRIAAVGDLADATADRVVDVSGKFVVPGFIDMHSHADRGLVSDSLRARQAHNLVAQGITTVVVGPDGRNPTWPIAAEMDAYRNPGSALNVVPMVGHGTVRGLVMGDDYERPATEREISRMADLVRQGMEDGAWGMGAGPEYRPGRFSTTEELIALAQVVADYDGFYYAHQRSQSPLPRWQTPSILPEYDTPPTWPRGWRLTATDGTQETIRIGRETGIRVVGSHIKAKGPSTWGHASIDVMLIEQARAQGVQVYLDQYPYETFGGGPTGVLPIWAFAPPGSDWSGGLDDPRWREEGALDDYKANLESNWADPEVRALLTRDIEHILDLQGGADRHIVVAAPHDPSLIGKSLVEIARSRRLSNQETLVRLALEGEPPLRDGVRFRPVAGHPQDVETYMRQEYTATSTDGGVSLRTSPGQHPRYYGAFPRKIAYYVKDRGVITLPFAIRSSTGLPAQIIGLRDRGLVREGYRADLVVFDFGAIRDRATILEPDLYPEGIEVVMVNGAFTMDGGQLTGALPGRVLDRRAGGKR